MECKYGIKCESIKRVGICNHCAGGNVLASNGQISGAGKELLKTTLWKPELDGDIKHLIKCH